MTRTLICTGALLTCLALASVADATPLVQPPAPTQRLVLDSYYAWSRHYTPPISTSVTLPRKTYYVATVSGTFSYYGAINYYSPQHPWNTVCGTPGSSTQNPGSLGGDGPVGMDAEFVFARPWTTSKCAAAHLPVHWVNFQANIGKNWAHPTILGASPSVPVSNHTYSYALAGDGKAARFRLHDVLTRDNYGLLKIVLQPATTSDCGSYVAFGFSTQTDCLRAIGVAGK